MQTSSGSSGGIWALATSYGGASSLFRGMAAPLSTACVVNAIIFSSYGWSSRLFDQYVQPPSINANRDSTIKTFTCGSFAGFVQGLVICPMEHLKCRLQVQHGKGSKDHLYKGPVQVAKAIFNGHGMTGLYRGWCATAWREVPAFGAYFTFYDFAKDVLNLAQGPREVQQKRARTKVLRNQWRRDDANDRYQNERLRSTKQPEQQHRPDNVSTLVGCSIGTEDALNLRDQRSASWVCGDESLRKPHEESRIMSTLCLFRLFKHKDHDSKDQARHPRKEHHATQPRALPSAADADLGDDSPASCRGSHFAVPGPVSEVMNRHE